MRRKPTITKRTRKGDSPLICGIILLVVGTILLIFLIAQLFIEQRQEQKICLLSARLSSQEITAELCTSMSRFNGFEELWTVVEADVTLSADAWQTSTTLLGVDLDTFPIKLLDSAGEKALGSRPLLLAGENLFATMTDQNGTRITERQQKILQESISTLTVQLTLNDAGTADLSGESDSSDGANADSDNYAQFLGMVSGSGLYMDASQMRTWLSNHGSTASVHLVWLQIKGKTNAEAAEKSLTEAGFQVEIPD